MEAVIHQLEEICEKTDLSDINFPSVAADGLTIFVNCEGEEILVKAYPGVDTNREEKVHIMPFASSRDGGETWDEIGVNFPQGFLADAYLPCVISTEFTPELIPRMREAESVARLLKEPKPDGRAAE